MILPRKQAIRLRRCRKSSTTIRMSGKTRAKILATAKEMGYLPNANARSLTTKRSWTIGILFVEATGAGIRHPYFGAVIESFKKIAVSKGYDLMFISKDVGGRRSSYVEHCKIRGVDGVVVILSAARTPISRSSLDSGIPCVILDSSPGQVHSVYSDNIGAHAGTSVFALAWTSQRLPIYRAD